MIYFDNSATTLKKPKAVAEAVYRGITSEEFGNPGRGAHKTAVNAITQLFTTRKTIAELFNIKNPLQVALCNNATSALNLVIKSVVSKHEHIITTALEHNSVLRPLYQLCKQGCTLSIIPFDTTTGNLYYDKIEAEIKSNTKTIIVNHGSNVIGSICNLDYIHSLCTKYNLIMIVDASQTAGTFYIDVSKYTNSIFCFTGHKGLYGPQGTGGIIVNGNIDFTPVFSGGSGIHSFDHEHPKEMPDVFEAGTMNVPAFMGLTEGCRYLQDKGLNNIHAQLCKLKCHFVNMIKDIPNLQIYGSPESEGSCIGLNLKDVPSAEVANILDSDFSIAVRSGAHCAPLLHETFKTEKQGIVRFSFSSFNTVEEINQAADALKKIAALFY